jgi:hypothetical protein
MNVTRKSRSNQGGMTVTTVASYAALIVLGFNGFAKADTLAFDHTFVFGNEVGVFTPVATEGVAGQVQLMDKAGDVLADAWFLDLPAFPLDLSNAPLSTIRGLVILGDEKIAAGADGHYAAAVQVAIWQTGYGGDFTSDFNDLGLVSQVLVDGEHTDDKHKGEILGFTSYPATAQSLVFVTPAVATPEPAPWALGLLGFSLMGLTRLMKNPGAAGHFLKQTDRADFRLLVG